MVGLVREGLLEHVVHMVIWMRQPNLVAQRNAKSVASSTCCQRLIDACLQLLQSSWIRQRRLAHATEQGPRWVQLAGSEPLQIADAARINVELGPVVQDNYPIRK